SQKMSGTEQRGVCAGGKKPTARSINRILKLFESFKIRTAGRKYFFDTLIPSSTVWSWGFVVLPLPGKRNFDKRDGRFSTSLQKIWCFAQPSTAFPQQNWAVHENFCSPYQILQRRHKKPGDKA